MELSAEQQREVAVGNLSKAPSWYINYGTPEVHFTIPGFGVEAGNIGGQLESLGLKQVVTHNDSSSALNAEVEMSGKEYVIVNTEAGCIKVVGNDNATILANAGVEFPGAKFHRSPGQGKHWASGLGPA